MTTWVLMHRGWMDNEIFEKTPLSEREAWMWLIEKAAWKDTQRRNLKAEIIDVARGEYHTSLRVLAEAWGWGKTRVDGFLGRLKKGHMIKTASRQDGCLITICNYDKYQATPDSLKTGIETASRQPQDTQERKEINKPFIDDENQDENEGKRPSRLSPDWQPQNFKSGKAMEIANRNGIAWLSTEFEKFQNHWITKAGSKGLSLDWQRTWGTWVINAQKYAEERSHGRPAAIVQDNAPGFLPGFEKYANLPKLVARED